MVIRRASGQNLGMTEDSWTPDYESVVQELRLIRERGLVDLRRLKPPTLTEVARLAGLVTSDDAIPAAIEDVLRQAADIFGGGPDQDVAEYTFGLAPGWRLRPASARRAQAALTQGMARKEPERHIIEQMAEGVLGVAREAALRQTRLDIENRRHPADSRLAVQWVERFEAYYRIWTPVSGLEADLRAAIQLSREEPADHVPWDPNSAEAFDPDEYVNMYLTNALCHYTRFRLELRRFEGRHGGLWLLSDADVEQQVADAIYRIGWHNNILEEDDAWLRRHLGDARHEEDDHFVHLLASTTTGTMIHRKWQAYGRTCTCQDLEHGDGPQCQVHMTIAACDDYMRLIDEDWMRIADWYRPGSTPRRGVEARELYDAHVKAARAQ